MHDASGRWTRVCAHPTAGDDSARRACLAAFFASGAQGVYEDGLALVTHFAPSVDLVPIHQALTDADSGVGIETALVADVDWTHEWKARLVAHELGVLSIVPPWLASGRVAAHTIVIDPGMAFGTGDHATTRGVVRLLPSVIRNGDIVADLGSGSAVLSIAAAKLGASCVYAIDVDPDATGNARENVTANGVEAVVHLFEADAAALLPLLGPVRVVVANIISSVLVDLLPLIASALTTDGVAVLSGILREERETMIAELTRTGWRLLQEDGEDIWWSASIGRA